MYFERVYDAGLAHASYVVGCQATGEAIVIDPKRDVDTYVEIAARRRLRVTHVTETHIHADFLSGARELARLTGAQMLLSDEGGPDWRYEFDHVGLRDGDVFMVGRLRFEVLHTPGHTPEHVSFLLTDTPAGDAPVMLFTGDFVFVGDVGRPDLLEKAAGIEGTMEPGARQLWQSLRRFRELPPFVQVWPAHGAGSACGKALGAVPGSTVGYEAATNWALRQEREDAFVRELLDGQPEPPKYFAAMKRLNKVERPLAPGLDVPLLSLAQLDEWLERGAALVDTRPRSEFARGHVPGSLGIQANGALSTWAGWLLDYETPIVVVADDDRIEGVARAFVRIGLDRLVGRIAGVDDWAAAGRSLGTVPGLSPAELKSRLADGRTLLVDVRSRSEFEREHIPGARHIHLGYLAARAGELPRDRPIVLQCEAGDRSSSATSVLARAGFRDVANLLGGIEAWRAAGLETTAASAAAV